MLIWPGYHLLVVYHWHRVMIECLPPLGQWISFAIHICLNIISFRSPNAGVCACLFADANFCPRILVAAELQLKDDINGVWFFAETKSTPDQVLFTVEAMQAFQGTAFYWFAKGKHDIEVMNSGDHPLDVFAVSNSELGDGLEHMLVWMEWLDPSTDVVLSNVNWTGSVLEGSRLKR